MTFAKNTFRWRDFWFTVGLFFAAVGLYSLGWFYTLSDGYGNLVGGVSTVGAERILRGDIPYRDFWTIYAPGEFYLLASLFRLFGTHLLVEVVAASMVCAIAACVLYHLTLHLVEKRWVGLACAAIFVAATYKTGYFVSLGSYPSGILFVFVALFFAIRYYESKKWSALIVAGLSTGAVILFKHDVGGYTAIAIVAGFIAYQLSMPQAIRLGIRSLSLQITAYGLGIAAVVLFPLIYFTISAGGDMLQDLVIFPLTDFRFARPESYPSLLPFQVYDPSPLIMFDKLCGYLVFTLPFALFCLGLVAMVLAFKEAQPIYVAICITFLAGFVMHYLAAHVQINTHIITLSVYGAWLGVIFCRLCQSRIAPKFVRVGKLLTFSVVIVWLVALAARPIYWVTKQRRQANVKLELPTVSGFRVTAHEREILAGLTQYVNEHVPRDQALFVGLNRHDVIIIGNVMIYFVLDRPIAIRYHELHPAIADTARVQQEIIADLEHKNVSVLILKPIFSDDKLDRTKSFFLKNLPKVGATDLDRFIRENYESVQRFGAYTIWRKKTTPIPSM